MGIVRIDATKPGIAMGFGRFTMIVLVLALAGSLALKKHHPVTAGTMPTHGPLFVPLLVGTVLAHRPFAFAIDFQAG